MEVNVEERVREVFSTEKYRLRLSQLAVTGGRSIYVDFEDIIRFDPELAKMLVEKPDVYLKALERAALDQLRVEAPEYAEQVGEVKVRLQRLPENLKVSIRKLGAKHINRLVKVEGIIVRSSPVKPLLVKAAFRCKSCEHIQYVLQTGTLMSTPRLCEACKKKGPFELVASESEFIDYQELRVQEKPEDLPPGQLPRWLNMRVYDELVDLARPGDTVAITGIVRALQESAPTAGKLRTFTITLEVNNLEVFGKGPETVEITPEEERLIVELSKQKDIHEKIKRSIAPSIYGYDDVKEAIMYLLFGGTPKVLPDGTRIRGDINILLVGDPGTGKSQILQYVQRISPRGLYTHGRGTTAAGLTAAVVKEKNGGMVLEAGALVLADQGVCAIDEIDKMRAEDRVAMHQAMEQQSYHPSVEVLLADGRKVRIGEFVDSLIEAEHSRLVKGVECEILPLEKPLEVVTVDLETLELKRGFVTRVSRHRAPDSFVRLRFSNGREILVTPEHPIFIFSDGYIKTVPASDVKPGDWAIGVRELPEITELRPVEERCPVEKTSPPELARVLGHLVSEGCSGVGPSYGVDFTDGPEALLDYFPHAEPSILGFNQPPSTHGGRTTGYDSSVLYRWLELNSPDALKRVCERRVPPSIMKASREVTREFLRAAFLEDGKVESGAVCFSTTSRGLAEDYQDLLLKLGITSKLVAETRRTEGAEERARYKVYVTGDSLARFHSEVMDPFDPRRKRTEALAYRSTKPLRRHEVLPTYAAKIIVDLMGVLGIPYDGRFDKHLERGYGVTERVVERYLNILSQRLAEIEKTLETERPNGLRELRSIVGWSRRRLSEAMKVKLSAIDYAERGGYSGEKRNALLVKALEAVRRELDWAKAEVARLRKLMRLRFLRVRGVEKVPNEGSYSTPWVYDITVEPTQNFVSHGLVLHNSISVAKGGIVATLNARTAVLAAANPALGRYDPNRTVAENINLPVTLLSRFDLIFVLKDRPDKERDTRLTEHILKLHAGFEDEVQPAIEPELLRKYISYSKRINPRMTEEAMEIIRDFYLKMRSAGELTDSPIAITARQLESIIRLAEARARVTLRGEVTAEDARAAVRLMKVSLEQVGIDMSTGKIDIDIIMTGKPKSLRDKLQAVIGVIVDLSKQMGMAEEEAVYEALEKDYGISRSEAVSLIEQLRRDGTIYSPRHGFLKKT